MYDECVMNLHDYFLTSGLDAMRCLSALSVLFHISQLLRRQSL